MIGLFQSKEDFDYDIRALIQAFYHGTKITAPSKENEWNLYVEYEETQVELRMETAGAGTDCRVIPYDEDKSAMRNRLKQALYAMLCNHTHRRLPWGTLTGVRPTKIAYEAMEQGKSWEETVAWYEETYLTTHAKAVQSATVARKERQMLSDVPYREEYSLYVGIPFCPSRCLYCSFTSYPVDRYAQKVGAYLDAMFYEMDYVAQAYQHRNLTTVYIGGGTPTSLSAGQLDCLLTGIEQRFDLSGIREFTVEAGRPDSITREKLEVLKKHRISRISINPQTMHDKTLQLIGRAHDVAQVIDCFHLAREVGFDNINMDIIVGLPGETKEDVEVTLKQIQALGPDSLTVHSLAIKRASNLNINMEQYRHLVKDSSQDTLDMVETYAADMGMQPYYLYRQKNMSGNLENVGYSTEGKECYYNVLIMEEKQDIIAVGAGASSKIMFYDENRLERVENVKDVDTYIARIEDMIDRKRDMFHGRDR
ncbi:MAG: coproporphyrinogen dehydrogenase HemZ [Lachnospiraceae bacterium]